LDRISKNFCEIGQGGVYMYYEAVFKALQQQRIRYAVAGGVALVLHGVVRFTADLDLIVDLEQENLRRFVKALQDLGYRPRNPVSAEEFIDPLKRKTWKSEKRMTVFSFSAPAPSLELVDVFIEEVLPFDNHTERAVYGNRERDSDPGPVAEALEATEESSRQAAGSCRY
jgi:hypothetical protein